MIKLIDILNEVTYKIKMPLSETKKIASNATKILIKNGFAGIVVAGSIRREKSEVGDIDMMAIGNLLNLKNIKQFDIKRIGGSNSTFIYKNQQINLYVYKKEYYGSMLLFLTGPQMYNIAYRARAKKMGMLLNQYGLFKNGKKIAGETEESIYQTLGKNWKEPSLRGI